MRKIAARHRPHARACTVASTPTVTRWHAAARAAGWTLLVMTLTAIVVFGLG